MSTTPTDRLRALLEPLAEQAGLDGLFREAVRFLQKGVGRVDAPLGDVQRLRRGAVDLPLGGGPDVLNATYGKRTDGRIVGTQGDSLVMLALPMSCATRSCELPP